MASTGPFAASEIVAGKYQVTSLLSVGGMGYLYVARHQTLGTDVVLKAPKASVLEQIGGPERFLREARAAARLESIHVCRVLDVDEDDRQTPFIVMERLQGSDLSALLKAGPIDPADAISYLIAVCEALIEAHSHGIYHRDIKPANLFLSDQPNGQRVIKLLDFGIASAARTDEESTLTKTHDVLGSPHYMSPEQVRGTSELDGRTDVWSIGVTLYELLLGRRPFDAEDRLELALNITSKDPPQLNALPPFVVDVVRRCLRRSRADRYQTVEQLHVALLEARMRMAARLPRAWLRRARTPAMFAGGATLIAVGLGGALRQDRGATVRPTTRFATVDLSTAANHPLDWVVESPSGPLEFGGVPFQILDGARSVIHTQNRTKPEYPTVVELPLGGESARRVHLLVSATWSDRPTSALIGQVIVYHHDGTDTRVSLDRRSTVRETWTNPGTSGDAKRAASPSGVTWINVLGEEQLRGETSAIGHIDMLSFDVEPQSLRAIVIDDTDVESGIVVAAITLELAN